ncbi:MAG: hypothetical protein R3Y43_06340 [Alphaproteobacteria bacterium]
MIELRTSRQALWFIKKYINHKVSRVWLYIARTKESTLLPVWKFGLGKYDFLLAFDRLSSLCVSENIIKLIPTHNGDCFNIRNIYFKIAIDENGETSINKTAMIITQKEAASLMNFNIDVDCEDDVVPIKIQKGNNNIPFWSFTKDDVAHSVPISGNYTLKNYEEICFARVGDDFLIDNNLYDLSHYQDEDKTFKFYFKKKHL